MSVTKQVRIAAWGRDHLSPVHRRRCVCIAYLFSSIFHISEQAQHSKKSIEHPFVAFHEPAYSWGKRLGGLLSLPSTWWPAIPAFDLVACYPCLWSSKDHAVCYAEIGLLSPSLSSTPCSVLRRNWPAIPVLQVVSCMRHVWEGVVLIWCIHWSPRYDVYSGAWGPSGEREHNLFHPRRLRARGLLITPWLGGCGARLDLSHMPYVLFALNI